MKDPLRRANRKVSQVTAEHPIEMVVVYSVVGFIIGRLLANQIDK